MLRLTRQFTFQAVGQKHTRGSIWVRRVTSLTRRVTPSLFELRLTHTKNGFPMGPGRSLL